MNQPTTLKRFHSIHDDGMKDALASLFNSSNLEKEARTMDTNPRTNRLKRYRDRHPRIDFYPSPDVLAILLHHRKAGIDPTLAGIIDGLIRVGHRAVIVSGNGKN